ncbi:MAG: hypothetical protein ACRBFS_09630 [Aureispira sp.]
MANFFKKIKSLFITSKQEQTANNQEMLFKNLKSLFVVSTESSDTENEEQSSADEFATDENADNTVQEIIQEFDIMDDFDERLAAALEGEILDEHGAVDNKIVEELLQKVGESNLDGFDYFEYKQSLKALDKMPMDEATKYRSAFATASTMGVTLQQLLESVDFYLQVLDQQDDNFQKDVDKRKRKQVDQKETETTKLKQQIDNYEDQIKRLKEKIIKNQTRIEELQREVKIDKVKIDKERNNFVASFSFLRSQFTDDVAKMKKYLK